MLTTFYLPCGSASQLTTEYLILRDKKKRILGRSGLYIQGLPCRYEGGEVYRDKSNPDLHEMHWVQKKIETKGKCSVDYNPILWTRNPTTRNLLTLSSEEKLGQGRGGQGGRATAHRRRRTDGLVPAFAVGRCRSDIRRLS